MNSSKIIFLFLTFLISSYCYAQPQKGTLGIGGSGFWITTKPEEGENLYKQLNFTADGQYFINNNLALGAEIRFYKYSTISEIDKSNSNNLFFSPFAEGYLFNSEKWGLSGKLMYSAIIYSDHKHDLLSNFIIGPKASFNITPSLSAFVWMDYRKLPEKYNVNYPGSVGAFFPSDNFDIRWGFNYYLHSLKE